MNGKPKTFEQYVYDGEEYDPTKGLHFVVEQAKAHAEQVEGFDTSKDAIRLECRTQERGAPSSVQAWSTLIPWKANPRDVVELVKEELIASPGAGFCGQVRINFKIEQERNPIKSYTRTIEAAVAAVDPMTGEHGVVVSNATLMHQYLGPALDVHFRFMDKVAAVMDAASNMMNANGAAMTGIAEARKPAPPPGPSGNLVTDLGRQLLTMGHAQANQGGTGGGGGALPPPPGSGGPGGATGPALPPPPRPPSPVPPVGVAPKTTAPVVVGHQAPAPPPALTASDVDRWARENPQEAEALAMRLYLERNG